MDCIFIVLVRKGFAHRFQIFCSFQTLSVTSRNLWGLTTTIVNEGSDVIFGRSVLTFISRFKSLDIFSSGFFPLQVGNLWILKLVRVQFISVDVSLLQILHLPLRFWHPEKTQFQQHFMSSFFANILLIQTWASADFF